MKTLFQEHKTSWWIVIYRNKKPRP